MFCFEGWDVACDEGRWFFISISADAGAEREEEKEEDEREDGFEFGVRTGGCCCGDDDDDGDDRGNKEMARFVNTKRMGSLWSLW